MARTDPIMIEGTALIMKNLPEAADRNVYYWYYATQVMHNQPGPDWDDWNRKMRRVLIETQATEGCAAGSWEPKVPQEGIWGLRGGRLMQTSLSALTLEVYYRYLPLYRLDKEAGPPAAAGESAVGRIAGRLFGEVADLSQGGPPAREPAAGGVSAAPAEKPQSKASAATPAPGGGTITISVPDSITARSWAMASPPQHRLADRNQTKASGSIL